MLEGPLADETAESPVEALRSEYLLAQQDQSQRGFEVRHRVTVLLLDRIRTAHQHRCARIRQGRHDLIRRVAAAGGELRIALGTVDPVVEGFRLVHIDEGVEALVHPRIAPLVESDDHRKPRVADLVRRDPEERLTLVVDPVE